MSWEIAVVMGLASVSFGLFYLASVLDEKHYPIKLLLMLTGLFNYVAVGATLPHIIESNESAIGVTVAGNLTSIMNGVFTGLVTVVLVVTAYFVIQFLISLVQSMRVKK